MKFCVVIILLVECMIFFSFLVVKMQNALTELLGTHMPGLIHHVDAFNVQEIQPALTHAMIDLEDGIQHEMVVALRTVINELEDRGHEWGNRLHNALQEKVRDISMNLRTFGQPARFLALVAKLFNEELLLPRQVQVVMAQAGRMALPMQRKHFEYIRNYVAAIIQRLRDFPLVLLDMKEDFNVHISFALANDENMAGIEDVAEVRQLCIEIDEMLN